MEDVYAHGQNFETLHNVWDKLKDTKEFLNVGIAPGDSLFVPFGTLAVTTPVLHQGTKGHEYTAWYCQRLINADNAKAVVFSGDGVKQRFAIAQLVEASMKLSATLVGEQDELLEFVKQWKDHVQPTVGSDEEADDDSKEVSTKTGKVE